MLNNERQDGAEVDNSTTAELLPSANLAQSPMLAAVLSPRKRPCICCSCPQCDAVFMAAALNEEYHCDDDANRELLNDLADYARKGYIISVKDASEFRLDYCEHLKSNKV